MPREDAAPVVMVARHRNSAPAPRRRASATTSTWSSTDQSSVFDEFDFAPCPESDRSVSVTPSLGPDPDAIKGSKPNASDIYRHDFMPPEELLLHDRSATSVVTGRSDREKRRGRRDRRRHRDRPTSSTTEEESVTSLPDRVSPTSTENAELNPSHRTVQMTSESHSLSPNSTHSTGNTPSMLYKDDTSSDADTPKRQKAVVAESSKPKLDAVKSKQLSSKDSTDSLSDLLKSKQLPSKDSTDSLSDLLKHHQEQSKLDQTPQHGDQNKPSFISGTTKEQSLTSLPDPMSLTINEECDINLSRQTTERTTESYPSSPSTFFSVGEAPSMIDEYESYPSSPSSFFSVGEIPSMLDEDDIFYDTNTLMPRTNALAERFRSKLEGLDNIQSSPSATNELLEHHDRQSTSDRCPLVQPVQTLESSDVTMSDSTTSYQEGSASRPLSSTRQVGLLRVRIEMLSTFDHCLAGTSSGDDLDSEADVTANDHSQGVTETKSSPTDNQEPGESPSTSPQESRSFSKRSNRDTTNPDRNREEGSDRENEGGNGPYQKRKKTVCAQQMVRFACPYQVFHTFQDCLKPGPRNPQGGCAGINRLKQHLCRRHMQSYRCQRCWGTFDSRRKVSDHEAQAIQCSSRERPPNEIFMTSEQEAEIEASCRSVTANEAWWNLFRLLIPGMRGQDIMSLSSQFHPYYIHRLSSFVIPSMTVSNILFEPVPRATSDVQQATHNTNPSAESDFFDSHGLNFGAIPSTPFEIQPEGSQTVDLPLLQILEGTADSDCPTFAGTTGTSSSNQFNSNFDSSSSSGIFAASLISAPATEASGLLEPSLNNQTQQQRNHERLRDRNRQSEASIAALRRAMHGTLEHLNHADTLVEDLLSLEGLTGAMYGKLESSSAILDSAKIRLQ